MKLQSDFVGEVTLILYDRNAKPRELPFDNLDGNGEKMYYPATNEDGFYLLVNIPIKLGKLLCGAHPDRYRLYKYKRAIPAQRTLPSGANQTVWICPWSYKKRAYRVDPSNPESELKFKFEFTEHRYGLPKDANILESKPVAPAAPPKPKPAPPPKRPKTVEPDVIDVDPTTVPPDFMPEVKEDKPTETVNDVPPVQSEVKMTTQRAEPPVIETGPEEKAPTNTEFPHIRSPKEILDVLRDKCKEVGADYQLLSKEYRGIIDKPTGVFGKNDIGGFENILKVK
jgi:hypothetical protein